MIATASLLLSLMAAIAPLDQPVDQPVSHVITGTAVNAATHARVHGATISLPGGKWLALTDRTGRFRAMVPTRGWPPALRVGAPGLATRDLELPHLPSDADLKPIALSAAARLHIVLPPVLSLSGMKVRWQLQRLIADKGAGVSQEGSFPAGRSDVTLDDVESANYALLVKGTKPLQQAITKVAVKTGESIDLPINITPVTLKLTVVTGEKPVAGAVVDFSSADFLIRGTVFCDERGAATEEMWQRGDFFATLLDHNHAAFGRFVHLDSDTDSISWTYEVPGHHVRGTVIDAATELPLKGVRMRISGNTPAEGGLNGTSSTTDEDGRFEMSAVMDGTHTLSSYLKGYRYDHPLQFTLQKEDGDFETTVRLEKIIDAHSLAVVDWTGTPVTGADMFLATPTSVILLEHSDESGHVTIPPGLEGVAFAVPRGGSFGFTYIPRDLSEDVSLRVPPPAGVLDVLSRSDSGDAIPNVFFTFRINGTLVPSEVFSRFSSVNSLSIRTDETGHATLNRLPSGLYELWPLRTASDVIAIRTGNPPEPPATVVIGDTPQIVTLTIRKKPSS